MVTATKRTRRPGNLQTIPNCAFPVLPNSFPVRWNFLPCYAELKSLLILSRELARKPRKLRVDSGSQAFKWARKNANSLIIPCIYSKAAQTERLAESAETRGRRGRNIGGNRRLRCGSSSLTRGNTGKILAKTENVEGDGGWWRRKRDCRRTFSGRAIVSIVSEKESVLAERNHPVAATPRDQNTLLPDECRWRDAWFVCRSWKLILSGIAMLHDAVGPTDAVC